MNDYQAQALATLAGAKTYEDFIDRTEFNRDTFGFVVAAARLENYKKTLAYGKNLPKFQSINPINVENVTVLHAKLGIAGESAEIFDAVTKDEVKLECGDLLWYMAVLLDEYGLTFEEVMAANIEKLQKRYKSGKFTQAEALNR